MDFIRTNAALNTLEAYSPEKITLQEGVALLRAVIEDITAEAAPLKDLSVSAQATTDWMAISRALLDADVSTDISDMSEKKQERLLALNRTYREKYIANQTAIEQAQQRLSAAEAENEELRQKIESLEQAKEIALCKDRENEALREQISSLEKEISAFEQSAVLLKSSHEESKNKLADSLLKKQSWERILEDTAVKLAQAEDELARKREESDKQEVLLAEKKRMAADVQNCIDEMKRQAAEAEQKIAELEAQKRELLAVDCDEMRRRAADLQRHNELMKESNTELQVQISSLTADIDRRKKVKEELSVQIEQLKAQAADAESELRLKKAEKEDQENLIIRLTNEKKVYEQALSPEEASRRKDDIIRLQNALNMYERIVRELFGTSNNYTMQAVKDRMQAFNSDLNLQINELQQRMNALNRSYLHVVNMIEHEVNSNDM